MDFADTPEEAAFRSEVRDWLGRHAKPKGQGDANAPAGEAEWIERARAWQRLKADAGYACIPWPRKWGGRDGTPIQDAIYQLEEQRFDVPPNPFKIGLGMCIPTIIGHGRPDVVERFVRPAVFGEEIWCQLFSEPAAGSDLAGIRTRAEHSGDGWIVNGQKIWTSRARQADYGLLLARTDPSVRKHAGLTMFWVPMGAHGIDIRPIRQMAGGSEFNEVFLDDVVLDDSQRIGEVGGGWQVAMTTLAHERFAVGADSGDGVVELARLARSVTIAGQPAIRDRAVRARLAHWYARERGLQHSVSRTLTALSRSGAPGPEASIAKLVSAALKQQGADFALDLMGPDGLDRAFLGAAGERYQQLFLWSPAQRIAGGTDEILRNVIAERVLGLPAEPRVDKDTPFNEQRTGP